jgi:hypothetical protein
MKYRIVGSQLYCYYKLTFIGYIDLESFNGVPIFYPKLGRPLYGECMLKIGVKIIDITNLKRQYRASGKGKAFYDFYKEQLEEG